MKKRILWTVVCLALSILFCSAVAENAGGIAVREGIKIPALTSEQFPKYEYTQVTPGIEFIKNLKAGWNLGNTFDAYDEGKGDPPATVDEWETYWSHAKVTRELIHAIRDAGFNLIRIPVSWHDHLLDENHTIDPAWLDRIHEVVDWAISEDFYVILNIHHDDDPNYLYPDAAHYEQSERYITSIWAQLAERFQDYNEHLIFEAMNEPRLVGIQNEWEPNPDNPAIRESMMCINELNKAFVKTVRAGGGFNPWRFLMISSYAGNWSSVCLDEYELPMDDKMIVEAHVYEPMDYAMNRNSRDTRFDLEKDKGKMDEVSAVMDLLYEKHIQHGVPVIIDEFGAVYRNEEDLQDRVNYASYFAAAASARGIPVVIWDNGNDYAPEAESFCLMDRNAVRWIYPEIAAGILENCLVGRPE